MAYWRSRKFVPDSDEEDTQEISQHTYQHGVETDEALSEQLSPTPKTQEVLCAQGQSDDYGQSTKDNVSYLPTKRGERIDSNISRGSRLDASTDLENSEDELSLPAPKASTIKQHSAMPLNCMFTSDHRTLGGTLNDGNFSQLNSSTKPDVQDLNVQNEAHEANDADGLMGDDMFSSDLSSVSSVSPPTSPRASLGSQDKAILKPENQTPIVLIEHLTAPQEANSRSSRRFRERKAIQLNPYAIEGQLYRDAWKSRGLKPMNIQQQHEQRTQDDPDINTSASDGKGAASVVTDHETQPLSLPEDESQPVSIFPSGSPANQDEFPDVDALLRKPLRVAVNEGFKRRKTGHTYTEKSGSLNNPRKQHRISLVDEIRFKVPKGFRREAQREPSLHSLRTKITHSGQPDTIAAADDRTISFQESNIRDASPLPSPAPTDASQSWLLVDDNTAFVDDVLPITTPPQLQTPATSSEHKDLAAASDGVEILPDRESDSNVDDELRSESGRSGVELSESESFEELLKAQRRTRGVLPASWHRLNFQEQKHRVSKGQMARRSSLQSPTKEARRGVARPIFSSNAQREAAKDQETYLMTDDDNSDSHSEQGPKIARISQSIEDFLQPQEVQTVELVTSDEDEQVEDNSVNVMLASTSHRRNGSRKGRETQQPKITDILRVSRGSQTAQVAKKQKRSNKPISNTSLPKRQRRAHALLQTRVKPKEGCYKVGILDVANSADIDDRATTPNFIHIANRTARQRKDKGRHSPTKKVFQMQSREDTQSVQHSLKKWKDGQLKHSKRGHQVRKQRNPLTERTANNVATSTRSKNMEEGTRSLDVTAVQSGSPQARPSTMNKDGQNHTLQQWEDSVQMKPRNQRKTNETVLGKKIASSVNPVRSYIPAQLEAQRSCSNRPIRLTQNRFALDRFFEACATNKILSRPKTSTVAKAAEPVTTALRRRKRTPRLIVPEIQQLPQEDLFLSAEDPVSESLAMDYTQAFRFVDQDTDALKGLGRFGTDYTSTFDVEHLPDGVLFDDTSLLGSGDFACSLVLRDLNVYTSETQVDAGSSKTRWRDWNEVVSGQICDSLQQVKEHLRALTAESSSISSSISSNEGQGPHSLDYIIRYFSTNLRFFDPIDRRTFVNRMKAWILLVVETLQDGLDIKRLTGEPRRAVVSISARILIIAYQLKQIASHELVPQTLQTDVAALVISSMEYAIRVLFQTGLTDFTLFSREAVRLSTHVSRQTARASVEAFVIIRHLFEQLDSTESIWDVLKRQDVLHLRSGESDVQALDRVWSRMFTLLPYFEINARGVVQLQSYDTPRAGNWKLVRELLKPVLDCNLKDSSRCGSTFNGYCRAIFGRCLRLIQHWKWLDCEGIIPHLFDFFARNDLRDLPFEESHGSPRFLENLTDELVISPVQRDRCFHVFLKVIGSGVRTLRLVRTDRWIGNCVFRLTPNHGRRLPKDQRIRQEDLNAVRNHFDLLCTLYWAAPSGHRLRLDVVRNLIDIEDSHRQACHLVVRSWSYLINYQLSTSEFVSAIDPFMKWYDEILEKAVRLHKLARIEVENDAKVAERSLGQIVSQSMREDVVANSQRHIEAILIDALCSLKRAITKAKTSASLQKLLSPSLTQVISLFDIRYPRVNRVIINALDVIKTYVTCSETFNETEGEDSQGFGDWSAFEELDPDIVGNSAITVHENIYKALRDLLSNAFGADSPADDSVLQSIVETWLVVAGLEVKAGNRSWDNYVGPYGQDSWEILQSTEQTRRFAPFFYSTLINLHNGIYTDNKDIILRQWAASLVERESLVKYQAQLTASLLNQDASEPLLDNPPFAKNSTSSKFEISITQFCERRRAVVECFLSNMRESVSFMTYHSLPERASLTRSYIDMVQHLMSTMKTNYQSLGQGSDIQGAYVSFVQQIVELLQQYTVDICKVDPFFTDASNFPLPDTDPEYIVGRLKNFGMRLNTPGGTHSLSTFLQTICERAAIEDKQEFYSSLIQAAMEDALECKSQDRITLGPAISRIIVPIYCAHAFSCPCGWIAATPILTALPSVLSSLIFHINSFSLLSVHAAESMLLSIIHSIHNSCTAFLSNAQLLNQPHTFRILSYYIHVLIPMLEPLEFLNRTQKASFQAFSAILQNVRDFILFLLGVDIHKNEDFFSSTDKTNLPLSPSLPASLQSAYAFAHDQLHDSLISTSRKCKWKVDDQGRYFFHRSGRWEEIRVRLGSFAEERGKFVERAKEFVRRAETAAVGLGVRKAGVRIQLEGEETRRETAGAGRLGEVWF